MSDGAVKAEFADRIDRLEAMAVAERNLRNCMTNFEDAQDRLVRAAERLQDCAHEWEECRERVADVIGDDGLTVQKASEYKLYDANDVMERFCEKVRLQQEAIAALEPAPTLDAQAGIEVETPPDHEPNAISEPSASEETLKADEADAESDALGEEAGGDLRERFPFSITYIKKDDKGSGGAGYEAGEIEDAERYFALLSNNPDVQTATFKQWDDQSRTWELRASYEAHPEPTSVLNDPELIAAVDRANASIAQDEPVYTEREIAKHEAAANFWGTALTRDNSHPQDAERKPFFGFMAAMPKPKPEEVC